MYDERGPVRSFWHGCLLILGGCLALWLAVQVVSQIWLWLVVAAALATVVVSTVAWARWRRGRW